jgi:uncharacterized repeat protein (TIGR03803 family)
MRRRTRDRAQGIGWFVVAAFTAGLAYGQTPSSEVVLHSFSGPLKGAEPTSPLLLDTKGNFYSTTSGGGPAGFGVVFRLDASGEVTALHSFTGGADGCYPTGPLIGNPTSGDIYGTAESCGGSTGAGVLFKLDASGNQRVLYTFTGSADGGGPRGGVIGDAAGNLYGTTSYGGAGGGVALPGGVVFKVDAAGHEKVLYSFTGGVDGSNPQAGVTSDLAGNLYGTTELGGVANHGVVFKLDSTGHETVLYSFTGGADGSDPDVGVIRDAAGNLYGTTATGGVANQGVVYKVDSSGRESVLYSFTGGADGGQPNSGLFADAAGNLYGTSNFGGTWNWGVLYRVNAAGQETVIYSSPGGLDGSQPQAGVIQDAAGNFYGVTFAGGPADLGVVYKLDPTAHETVLYSFTGGPDGSQPESSLIGDSEGNVYGTALYGGALGGGVVFKVDSAGDQTILYNFSGGADGGSPAAGVIRDAVGNFYGTTLLGGLANQGVVYKLDATGHENVLYSFTGEADGANPQGTLIGDPAGNLYGTATWGGAANEGVVFKLDATGVFTVLHSFTGGADGGAPSGALVRDAAGNLYGTTYYGGVQDKLGVIFRIDQTGHETVLHSFTSWTGGGYPNGSLVGDSQGNLYGTTQQGGGMYGGYGTVFKMDSTGHLTVLYSFTSITSGGLPYSGVIRDSAGNLYGTATYFGGTTGEGLVFMLDPSGHETVLYSFTGGLDGGEPYGGLYRDSDGNLFGTTVLGGKRYGGVLFHLATAP